jgi:hypothetical protein
MPICVYAKKFFNIPEKLVVGPVKEELAEMLHE